MSELNPHEKRETTVYESKHTFLSQQAKKNANWEPTALTQAPKLCFGNCLYMPEPQRVHRWCLSSGSHRTSHEHQVQPKLICDSYLLPVVCTYKAFKMYPIFLHAQKSISQIQCSLCISSQHASGRMLSLLCCHRCCAALEPVVINYGCNAKAVKFVVSSIIFMLKATKALQWSQPLRNDRYCYQASL